jgi:hypothetical protein
MKFTVRRCYSAQHLGQKLWNRRDKLLLWDQKNLDIGREKIRRDNERSKTRLSGFEKLPLSKGLQRCGEEFSSQHVLKRVNSRGGDSNDLSLPKRGNTGLLGRYPKAAALLVGESVSTDFADFDHRYNSKNHKVSREYITCSR